jgi:hypothetical protein
MWGKRNMFTDVTDPGFGSGSAEFHFQHDPRFTGRNRFTLFDNHSMVNGFCDDDICSRGLEVEFDPDALTVRMVAEWYHPQRVSSGSRGGVQRTGGNSTLIAWGQNPLLTEHDADGRLAMDVQRGQVLPILHGIFPVLQYRVWKGDWEGRPSWPPSIACSRDDADARSLHVSWNGATEVDRYVLLSAEQATAIDGVESVVAQSPRNGFETKFNLHGLDIQRYVRIAALDAEGAILGSTGAVDTTNCAVIPLNYTVTDVFGGADRSLPDIPSSTSVVVPSGTGLAVYGFFKDVEVESDSEVTDDTENSGSDGQDNGEEETAVENGASKTKTTAGGEMPSGTSGDNASGLTTSNLFGVAAVAGSVSAITGLLV